MYNFTVYFSLLNDMFFYFVGEELSMLAGNVASIVTGGLITVTVTLFTRGWNSNMTHEVWENTRDIDNPLCPWTERYAR